MTYSKEVMLFFRFRSILVSIKGVDGEGPGASEAREKEGPPAIAMVPLSKVPALRGGDGRGKASGCSV